MKSKRNGTKEIINNTKKEKGITLVALILTVILLVVLSLVGISVIYNTRMIEYAMTGTAKYNQEGINENKVIDATGKLIDSAVDDIREVGKIPAPTVSIPEANGENGWYKTEDVTIEIKDKEADATWVNKIVYILDGETVEVEGKIAIVKIDTNGIHKIKAYATDGKTKSEETEEYTIKRDVADPNKVELGTPTEVTISSFKVMAKVQDITSGIKKIKFELSTGEDFSTIIQTQEYTVETVTTEERTQEHTFNGLNDGTPYYIRVTVTDEAGRTSTSSTVAQNTVVANTAPSKAQVSYNTKGTNYIKVNAKAEDVDGDRLTYILRYGTDQNNLNLSTDLTNQTQDEQISIQTTANLSEYTYYYWRVDVSDGKATTQGDVQSQVRTYCAASSCGGGGRSTVSCPATTTTTTTCTGKLRIGSNGGVSGSTAANTNCAVCGVKGVNSYASFLCNTCGQSAYSHIYLCASHGYYYSGTSCGKTTTTTVTCSRCGRTRILLYILKLYPWI